MILIAVIGGAGVLQYLGPLPISDAQPRTAQQAAAGTPSAGSPGANATPTGAPAQASQAPAQPPPASLQPQAQAFTAPVSTPSEDQTIAPPVPALSETLAAFPNAPLPRIAADGRQPMQVYARPFDAADPHPRVALVFAGAGESAAETRTAIAALPGQVTLAFSPGATDLGPLLADARAHGHEYLVSIPMEPQGYPLNDPGRRALMTGADPRSNEQNLLWALSRVPGATGGTGALDGFRGERLAAARDPFNTLQVTLASRGLLYVDPRPGASPLAHVAGRDVDLVIDDPPDRQAIDARLAQLEKIARDKGSALGLAGPLRPVTVDQVDAWARGLAARGITLAPASALAAPKPTNRT